MFNGIKPLNMKESENHIFHFPCSEKSGTDLFRASLSSLGGSYVGREYNPGERDHQGDIKR